jgi:hypothetical protein
VLYQGPARNIRRERYQKHSKAVMGVTKKRTYLSGKDGLLDKYFLIVLALNVVFFSLVIFPNIKKHIPLPNDTYRDIAYGQSILNGNSVFSDPAIKGEFIWYPPLNPLLTSFVSRITGISLFKLYAYSPLVVNFSIPLLFYVFIGSLFGKKHAFLATVSLAVMPWLKTHLFSMGMPSIHSFALVLATLIVLRVSAKRGLTARAATAVGILTGIALLHHSLSGLILFSSVCLFLLCRIATEKRLAGLLHFFIIVATSLLLWAPFILPNLLKPRLNYMPMHYFAPELTTLKFTVLWPNKYLCVFFLVFFLLGLIRFCRNANKTQYQLILSTLIITGLGQALGYLNHLSGRYPNTFATFAKIPYLIPHEFQWYFQLFALVVIAEGFVFLADKLLGRHAKYSAVVFLALALPAYVTSMDDFNSYPRKQYTDKPPRAIAWIRENTPANSVFLTSESGLAYFTLQPFTARPIIFHSPAHMNYSVDANKRYQDKYMLLFHLPAAAFKSLAKEYDIEYILVRRRDLPPGRIAFFNSYFKKVYQDGEFSIFKLKDT